MRRYRAAISSTPPNDAPPDGPAVLTVSAPDGTAPAPAPPGFRARLAASPTVAAAGLAAAAMAANLVAVVFTVIFTRLLGRAATARSPRCSTSG